MTDRSSPAIEVLGLKKTYKSGWFGTKRFQSLAGVDLQVRRGEVFGLLGPNGAGKTTLIKVLLGIIRPSGGSATVLGERAGSKAARKQIGYLPENLNFASHQTALRAMRFYGRLSRMDESAIRKRSHALIDLVGLAGRERELVTQFSKGMRQRLGLAQAMLHDPNLLVLDEPTDGLDPVGRSQIRQLISLLRDQGKTVFLNSHILQEVELICDRVAILVNGTLRGVGRPRELSEQFHGALGETVTLELAGVGEALDALARDVSGKLTALPNERWLLSAPVNSQSDVDQIVDRVRAQGASLIRLERSRPSLEQVFLSMVAEPRPQAPAPMPAQVMADNL
ncbi:MAG: ABC transporter ATP-binding protein [Aureliella sp.]